MRASRICGPFPPLSWRCRSAPACAIPTYRHASVVTSGQWRIERQTDRVTGAPISSACVTRDGLERRRGFPAARRRCSSRASWTSPVISFGFEFKIGTNLNSFLGYRFDEKPGHEIGARFVARRLHRRDRDDKRSGAVRQRARDQQLLYVRIRSLNAGRTTAEFKVDGAPAAIAAAFAGCPVKPPAPPQRGATPAPRRRSACRRARRAAIPLSPNERLGSRQNKRCREERHEPTMLTMAAACTAGDGIRGAGRGAGLPDADHQDDQSRSAPAAAPTSSRRILAQRMQEKLGQNVIVENRPGAGGLLGNEAVANAPKDGYTLGVQTAGQIIASVMTKNMRYDAVERVRLDRADRDRRPVHRGAAGLALPGHQVAGRRGQGQSGQDRVRQPRLRRDAAPRRRTVQADRRHRTAARALPHLAGGAGGAALEATSTW